MRQREQLAELYHNLMTNVKFRSPWDTSRLLLRNLSETIRQPKKSARERLLQVASGEHTVGLPPEYREIC